MLSTPTAPATIIAGETLGRVLIGVVQAGVIILGSALLFGVRWGQPIGVAAVVFLFVLVGAGAGILLGTLFRNEQQAVGVSLLLGLGLGALGGCMVPLEVFSPTMRRVAHFTPQAWGNDAFSKLVAPRRLDHGHPPAARGPRCIRRGTARPGDVAAPPRPRLLVRQVGGRSALAATAMPRGGGWMGRGGAPW